jgi:hypothetical protein
MAKLSVEVDTTAKTYSVKIDGTDIPNVQSARFSNYGDDIEPWVSFCVDTLEKFGEGSDVRKMITLCASETSEAKAAVADGTALPSGFAGVVKVPGLTAAQQWLLKQRGG